MAILVACEQYADIAKQLQKIGYVENRHFWNGLALLKMIQESESLHQTIKHQGLLLNRCLHELTVQRELNEMRYRDLMAILQFKPQYNPQELVDIERTEKVAIHSVDHLRPRGTAIDNTRWPAFVRRCEELFDGDIAYLDLGCSGGGLVFDFALRGHFALGLEGSDYSLKRLRSEWRTIPDNLLTCNIAKPFFIKSKVDQTTLHFHVISCWDVVEICRCGAENNVRNVREHLREDGFFVGTVATRAALPTSGADNHHVTVEDKEWWLKFFKDNGFRDVSAAGVFAFEDFPRGTGNFNEAVDLRVHPELGFHFVLMKAPVAEQ
jgi:SAM-dependent methyltransferase